MPKEDDPILYDRRLPAGPAGPAGWAGRLLKQKEGVVFKVLICQVFIEFENYSSNN